MIRYIKENWGEIVVLAFILIFGSVGVWLLNNLETTNG